MCDRKRQRMGRDMIAAIVSILAENANSSQVGAGTLADGAARAQAAEAA